ncbi:MAG TPA: 3-phosphoserine/phosphohydroxythreonine transaminase [Nevskiaceae bacterium]
MSRVFNFNAGPAALPLPVLEQVREDLPEWHGCGMSVLEMSHRAEPFLSIARQAGIDLRKLLGVPDGYHVLFMQGGATAQFAAVPMNLLGEHRSADYVVTGTWSQKAAEECGKYGQARIAARPADGRFTRVPPHAEWKLDPDAAYLHYTPNETIAGVEFHWVPEGINVPLVADFSSSFLSHPVDVKRFGLIYAGAQKNAGAAGITIVVVRKELLDRKPLTQLPKVLDYREMAARDSMMNTPPTFAWYVSGLVFRWLLDQGGLEGIAAVNARKSGQLYDYIDSEAFYVNPVDKTARSRMNVVFTLADAARDADFLAGAKRAGLVGLKGHRSVGGMRASLYNAVPEEAVKTLVEYMREFARTHG